MGDGLRPGPGPRRNPSRTAASRSAPGRRPERRRASSASRWTRSCGADSRCRHPWSRTTASTAPGQRVNVPWIEQDPRPHVEDVPVQAPARPDGDLGGPDPRARRPRSGPRRWSPRSTTPRSTSSPATAFPESPGSSERRYLRPSGASPIGRRNSRRLSSTSSTSYRIHADHAELRPFPRRTSKTILTATLIRAAMMSHGPARSHGRGGQPAPAAGRRRAGRGQGRRRRRRRGRRPRGRPAGSGVRKPARPRSTCPRSRPARTSTKRPSSIPTCLTDRDGVVTLEFKMPEALTRWRFLGFAHTQDLESGSIEGRDRHPEGAHGPAQPAPRFLREGDALEFTVKVTNMTEKEAAGAVELTLLRPVQRQAARRGAGQRRARSWPSRSRPSSRARSPGRSRCPTGWSIVGYKAVAATPEFSDGEEGAWCPSSAAACSSANPSRSGSATRGEKAFDLQEARPSRAAPATLRHLGLTRPDGLQSGLVRGPGPALPDGISLRMLGAGLQPALRQRPGPEDRRRRAPRSAASSISGRARRPCNRTWRRTRTSRASCSRNRPGSSRPRPRPRPSGTSACCSTTTRMRAGAQARPTPSWPRCSSATASWPWFPGGRGDSYITLYLATGFGRLKHLGVTTVSQDLALKAIGHLDGWIRRRLPGDRQGQDPEVENHLSPIDRPLSLWPELLSGGAAHPGREPDGRGLFPRPGRPVLAAARQPPEPGPPGPGPATGSATRRPPGRSCAR